MSDNPGNTAILEAITALRATIEERFDLVSHQIVEFEAQEARAEERWETRHTALRTDLMERLDRLQEDVASLREESVVNTASNDIARRGHDRMHEMILSLQRQVQRMQSRISHLEEKS